SEQAVGVLKMVQSHGTRHGDLDERFFGELEEEWVRSFEWFKLRTGAFAMRKDEYFALGAHTVTLAFLPTRFSAPRCTMQISKLGALARMSTISRRPCASINIMWRTSRVESVPIAPRRIVRSASSILATTVFGRTVWPSVHVRRDCLLHA